MDKQKEKIQSIPKNLKINTRIVITSLLGIIIPTVLIITFAAIFLTLTSSDITTVSSNSYSFISQIQWSQTVSEITGELIADTDDAQKLERISTTVKYLEGNGTVVYIAKDGNEIYKSPSDKNAAEMAAAISGNNEGVNSYYFGENGLAITATASTSESVYRLIMANDNFTVSDISLSNKPISFRGTIINRTSIIISVIVLTFIFAIVIISLITTKTIVGPIDKITRGANELAAGNFDYEIDYSSKNELGLLTDRFNDMRLRLKDSLEKQSRADQKQKEMIAGIAHDLRTPLTSVKGYLEGLRDGIADTPEKQKKYMDIIYTSTCDTEKMLDDLLAISKLELGSITLNCEQVNIDDFIDFAAEIGEELKKSSFDFEIVNNTKTSPTLSIDTDRFSRVVNNIISNSIKYKNPDIKGKIILTISEYERTVIFEIKDNGMGVDRESLPRIFDTLYRADKARSNVRDGSGLGLAICKQIVELHGGLIWAQSEAGNGLSIFISLPIFEEKKYEKNSDR